MSSYTLLIVNGLTGATVATISTGTGEFDAQVDSVTWALNDHDYMSFRIPKGHASIASIAEMKITSEIRLEKDGYTIFWGIPTRSVMGSQFLNVQCSGLTYYFEKRFIGDATRTNYIVDPDFELGTTGAHAWAEADPGSDITDSYDTAIHKVGTRSVRVQGNDRAADTRANGDAITSPVSPGDYHGIDAQYAQNTAALFTGENFFHVMVAKAWYMIRDDATYTYNAKPFEKRGFYIQTKLSGVWTGRHWSAEIDDTTERNVWLRAEFEILVYGGETVEIRLYVPGGAASPNSAINWDSTGLFLEESLSFYGTDGEGTDIVEIMEGLILHAQGQTVLGQPGPSNKDDLNIIADPANTTVGTKIAIAYQHADHANIWESLNDMANTANGADFRITWNAANTIRYLRVDRPIGSTKAGFALQIDGASSNIIDIVNYARDGENVANVVVALGEGAGPDREEAEKSEKSVLGVAWEDIIRAPGGWEIDLLDELAAGEHANREDVGESFTVRLTDSDFATVIAGNATRTDDLLPGDTVAVTAAWGNISWEDQSMKLVRLTLIPPTGVYIAEFNVA